MAFELLRRTILTNNTGIGAPFFATNNYFDTETRRPYSTQEDSQTNNPFELTRGDEVYRYTYRPGKTRVVRYDGNGSVYTENIGGTSANRLAVKVDTLTPYTENPNTATASLDLTGTLGQPPYQLVLVGTLGSPTASYRQTATSVNEIYPVRFYNLIAGEYVALATDALGTISSAVTITVRPGGGYSRGVNLREDMNVISSVGFQWRYNERDIKLYTYGAKKPGQYLRPYGEYVDGFLLSGGTTWRQVYSDGQGGVYFKDISTATSSTLAVDNLILFHPDTVAEQNGGILLEMNASAPPLQFRLHGVTNTTGSFDGLAAGVHPVLVTDAVGNQFSYEIELKNRYGLRYQLVYDDIDSVPLRLELWCRSWEGEVSDIYGQQSPVVLKSDGLNSEIGGQGDLPAVVGSSAELNLLVPSGFFEDLVRASEPDRLYRADVYRAGVLQFRGYLQADVYDAPLLSGLQPVSITATDGLAALKDTDMVGDTGQRLGGHRPWLNTILHCLSRTEIALPIRFYVNRRDSAMATMDAPELLATTNRTGYWDEDKNEPILQREVVEALAQAAGGTLVQRAGAWEIRSALEAALPALGRAYLPAGTPAPAGVAAVPSGAIRPPGRARWHWLEANQASQVRPGWKSLTGSTDTMWLKNAYWQGEVFNDVYAWLDDASKLRGVSGWAPAFGQTFPLVLSRLGEKGKDHSTQWLRSANGNSEDGRYLQGPALPLAPGTEAVPALLHITGKLVPAEFYADAAGAQVASPTTAKEAILPYEVLVDGLSTGIKLATIAAVTSDTAKDTVFEVALAPLPSAANTAVLRLYSWHAADQNLLDNATIVVSPGLQVFKKGDVVKYDFGTGTYRLFVAIADTNLAVAGAAFQVGTWPAYFAELTATNAATGQLFITSVGVELRPQNATWDGEDNFRADGPAGSVRPTQVLKVGHADVPLAAGLYGGNLFAFGRGVGLADGTQTTSWSRAIDKLPSPLLEADVFDQLALRANPSRLFTGTIRHQAIAPPYLLDSVDAPFDIPGRRFIAGATSWDMKAATVEVSLIEIGAGQDVRHPWLSLPKRARATHSAHAFAPGLFAPGVRLLQGGGVRVTHP